MAIKLERSQGRFNISNLADSAAAIASNRIHGARLALGEKSRGDIPLDTLKQYTVDASLHNAERDGFVALIRVLKNPDIRMVELDAIFADGIVFSAHSKGDLREQVRLDPSAIVNLQLEYTVGMATENGTDVHIDTKPPQGHRKRRAMADKLVRIVDKIPDDRKVLLSGRDWEFLRDLHQRIERPHMTLLTVDGHTGDTRGNFKATIQDFSQDNKAGVGVSIKDALLKKKFLEFLKKNGYYVLAFTVNSAHHAAKLAGEDVNITSDRTDIVGAIGGPKKEFLLKEGRPVSFHAS